MLTLSPLRAVFLAGMLRVAKYVLRSLFLLPHSPPDDDGTNSFRGGDDCFFFASPRTRLDSNPINIIDARILRTTTSRSCRVIDLRTRTNAHIQLCERGLVCFDCVRHFYADIYVFSLLVMLFFCFSWDSLSLSRLEILCFCWLFSRFRERILTARSLTGECSRWNSRGHL